MSLFRMTQDEYDRMNPPMKVGEVCNDDNWLYVGHIPKPKTRLGWFVYNIIHGLAMRYRVLPVLAFSISELFRGHSEQTFDVFMPATSDEELLCDYDEVSDTLYVFFDGIKPNVVEWTDDSRVALLKDETTDRTIGIMVDRYRSLLR